MALESFKLIIITPETSFPKEAEVIIQLFEEGLELLHIRKPFFKLEEMKRFIEAIPESFHSKIVIHTNYALLHHFNLKGAHLPETVRKESGLNEIKNVISTSFHALEDISNEKVHFEYAFLSPAFQSISKQGYTPSLKPELIKDFFRAKKNDMNFPVIALGGITNKNIMQVKDIGFSGAACIGYIWESSNPLAQFQKLQRILKD